MEAESTPVHASVCVAGIPISMYITGVVVATVVFTGAACATL